jgi:hypothetical protein
MRFIRAFVSFVFSMKTYVLSINSLYFAYYYYRAIIKKIQNLETCSVFLSLKNLKWFFHTSHLHYYQCNNRYETIKLNAEKITMASFWLEKLIYSVQLRSFWPWIKIVSITYDDISKGCHPLNTMIAREAALIYLGNELLTYCLEQNWRRNFVQGGVMGVEQDICKNGQMYPSCWALAASDSETF